MARMNRNMIKTDGEAYYHVVSRIANSAFLLRDAERKRHLLDMLRRAAEFSGVDVATYAIMDNHVHICVRVPKRRDVDEGEVLRRVGVLYGKRRRESLEQEFDALRAARRTDEIEAVLGRLRARMGDLSEFMKTFKQRVSQWYNGKFGHEGTLWGGRFKSVLVENGEYLRAVVRYIHGNPVRARIVRSAEEYEWSALGAAARGDAFARKGLTLVGLRDVEGLPPEDGAVRDRRLSNGVVVGSRRFVERSEAWPAVGRRVAASRIVVFSHGGVGFFSTHGQRSAPAAA